MRSVLRAGNKTTGITPLCRNVSAEIFVDRMIRRYTGFTGNPPDQYRDYVSAPASEYPQYIHQPVMLRDDADIRGALTLKSDYKKREEIRCKKCLIFCANQ